MKTVREWLAVGLVLVIGISAARAQTLPAGGDSGGKTSRSAAYDKHVGIEGHLSPAQKNQLRTESRTHRSQDAPRARVRPAFSHEILKDYQYRGR